MDNKQKMNVLFILGFILAFISLAAAGGAAFVGYYMNKTEWAAVIGGAGAMCAFIGIILAYCSKPKVKKRKKRKKLIDNPENDVI